ncbi:hypothetical protein As57867_007653, partial [Aphanomyces stellatus]
LFALFDSLYLLSNGRTVYFGKAADSVAYFSSMGFPCPNYMNPTDYFMRQIIQLDDASTSRVSRMVDVWLTMENTMPAPKRPDYATQDEVAAYTESRLGLE